MGISTWTFNPNTPEAEAGRFCEFEDILIYLAKPRLARDALDLSQKPIVLSICILPTSSMVLGLW